jgi:hypothetical protein
MIAIRFIVFLVVLLCMNAENAVTQEKTRFYSGPQAGEKLPSLKVVLVYGKQAGKKVDLIEQAAGRPALIVIVNGANRPAAQLTRILMNFAEMRHESLFAAVVYLDKDVSGAEQQLKRAISWWKVAPPVGISLDGGEGPGSYGLNRNVNLTILVANKGRVTNNFALVQPSETDAAKILTPVVAVAGGRVPGNAEVFFLATPTAKPANARWHTAPTDLKMRKLICDALSAEDSQSAGIKAAVLEKYVRQSRERQVALGAVASLFLERRGRAVLDDLPISRQIHAWKRKYSPTDTQSR